jgi:hypothetical protein
MLPFGVTIPATVPQGSEIPEGLMNNPVYYPDDQTQNNVTSGEYNTYGESRCSYRDLVGKLEGKRPLG